jgi:pimeloyl-ACP methyl ester carboxylesterase
MRRTARRGVMVLVVAVLATACTGPFGRVFPPTDACHGFDRLTRCGQVSFSLLPGYDDPATPDNLDHVGVLKIGPQSAHNVLVLNPGTSAGSAYFLPLAQDIVRDTRGRWQVWSVERRENQLEDHSILNLYKQGRSTSQQLFDYYLGWHTDPSITRHFQPISDTTVSFARGWGLNVEIEDLHRVVEAAHEHGRTVVLGGHSLGGSITTAYATWDFNGTPGSRDLAGLVYIDGGSNPTPVTSDQANLSLQNLQTSSPWLAFGGIPAPYLGLYAAAGSTATVVDPNGRSLGQTFALLPANIKAPVPATNEAEFGFAVDANSSPPNLRAAQVHVGQLAASGDPRGWDRAGAISPIQRYASMLSGTGLRNLDGSAWYHPMRLTIDAGAVADGNANPAQSVLDVKATHGHDLSPNTLIYAFGAALGGQGVLDSAQVLAAQSGIPAQNLTLVNRQSTYSHNDPSAASPQNDFLDGLIPFLARTTHQPH